MRAWFVEDTSLARGAPCSCAAVLGLGVMQTRMWRLLNASEDVVSCDKGSTLVTHIVFTSRGACCRSDLPLKRVEPVKLVA